MKVTFLLPTPGDTPIGGVKIIYEHANHLANAGHNVSIVHTMTRRTRSKGFFSASSVYVGRLIGLRGGFGPRRWMTVHPNVRSIWVPALVSPFIPKADILVATAWTTAESALTLPSSHGEKYYFVQDYEHYMTAQPGDRMRMAATYRAPFKNLVISPACRDMVINSGGEVHAMVPNGLDTKLYRMHVPDDHPTRNLIGFPSRSEPFKRTEDAIEALVRFYTRNSASGFEFWTFGNEPPAGLPEWIKFHRRPKDEVLVDLYNHTSIFLVPSLYEGWGLPGSEAMCCGAALVSTDNGGVNAYAEHEKSALLSAPLMPSALTKNIERLAYDSKLRSQISQAGYEQASKLTWSASSGAFLSAIS